jgi:hypothetical protein
MFLFDAVTDIVVIVPRNVNVLTDEYVPIVVVTVAAPERPSANRYTLVVADVAAGITTAGPRTGLLVAVPRAPAPVTVTVTACANVLLISVVASAVWY